MDKCHWLYFKPSSGRVSLDDEMVYDGHWLQPDLQKMRLEKLVLFPIA